MSIAFSKLDGLDRERVLGAVLPVLLAHNVEGVELVWKTDRSGWLLELTIERPGTTVPGAGVTVDLCSRISRDLSSSLDALDVAPVKYRLEVGSPGIERALYSVKDYERFAGRQAKVKVEEASARAVHTGTLLGLDDEGRILLDTGRGVVALDFERILSGRLVFEWKSDPKGSVGSKGRASKSRGKSVVKSKRTGEPWQRKRA